MRLSHLFPSRFKSIGYKSPSTISAIIKAKEARERFSVPENVSTTTFSETASLDDKTRVKILKKIQKGEINSELKNKTTEVENALLISLNLLMKNH